MVLMRSISTLEKGATAPNFSLKSIDESTVSLRNFIGKNTVIIFMCNHCPYVKSKLSVISELQEKFVDVVFLCINSNDPEFDPEDSFDNMRIIASQFGFDYYLFDESQEVARKFGAVCTPDVFVIDKSHQLFYHGRINDAMHPSDKVKVRDLENVLISLEKGKSIKEWFLPSMGCSIKWK